jgi:predicted metal-dependent hydrolase
MPPAELIRPSVLRQVSLGGRELACRLVRSKAATRLRIKVSKPDEVELILPESRTDGEGLAFLTANAAWVLEQLERAQRRLAVRRPDRRVLGQVLLGGETVPVQVVLRYIVTHEVVHLAIPDHSQRFWLTVQSLCPNSDRARQWLVASADRLLMADCIAAVATEDT